MITLQLEQVNYEVIKMNEQVVMLLFADPQSGIKVAIPFMGDSWEAFRQKTLEVASGVTVAPAAVLDQLRRNGHSL
jgi:hypothetical protein